MAPTSFSHVTRVNIILNGNLIHNQDTYFKLPVHSSMLAKSEVYVVTVERRLARNC